MRDSTQVILDERLFAGKVEEVLTQAAAESNVLTFSDTIKGVEIYHAEATAQEFEVNGLTITVPPGGWRSPIGGVPSKQVTIPAGVDCIVMRLS